ncbi:MAG: GNAT family N-acetyltransferase [Candidatus Obscuribacterales bacterium]|jgi:N-acetylglutamate synthase-like GNAT family acetyltransferase|nr:GNAT family N-acetyltransferase [Candidatus Obscuribacterales bacterium]
MTADIKPTITIRKASTSDVDILERIIQYAYRGGKETPSWTNEYKLVQGPRITKAGLHEILNNPKQVLLVAESDSIIGCVCINYKTETMAHLSMLAVDPDSQSGGIGKQLIRAAEECAYNHFGAREVEITVLTSRDELMDVYRRYGFKETGETEPFLGPESGVTPLVDDLHFHVMKKSCVPKQ